MKKLFFLIGASGAGKTTAAQSFEALNLFDFVVCSSDSLPVPSTDEMIKQYGSQEEWQRASNIRWVKKIKEEYLENKNVLLDTQSRPSFIDEACLKNGISDYKVILFDCSDEERKRRLVYERNQPDLANEQMMNWANYLRERCVGENYTVLDNSVFTPQQSFDKLVEILKS
jgi:dephospho-CoA kinase